MQSTDRTLQKKNGRRAERQHLASRAATHLTHTFELAHQMQLTGTGFTHLAQTLVDVGCTY